MILLLALLWPYSSEKQPFPVTQQGSGIPLQADLQDNGQQQAAEPEPEGNWQRYQIQPGQTLAQLFRDNSLPVNEVFAMAQVEGSDKPLSNMKVGQEVRIERDANGSGYRAVGHHRRQYPGPVPPSGPTAAIAASGNPPVEPTGVTQHHALVVLCVFTAVQQGQGLPLPQ